MSGVLHYRAVDERGDQILDELEVRLGNGSADRLPDGERIFFIVGPGESDLDPNLAAIVDDWAQHVERITPRG